MRSDRFDGPNQLTITTGTGSSPNSGSGPQSRTSGDEAGIVPTIKAIPPPAEIPLTTSLTSCTLYSWACFAKHRIAQSPSLTAAGAFATSAKRYSTLITDHRRFKYGNT